MDTILGLITGFCIGFTIQLIKKLKVLEENLVLIIEELGIDNEFWT